MTTPSESRSLANSMTQIDRPLAVVVQSPPSQAGCTSALRFVAAAAARPSFLTDLAYASLSIKTMQSIK
ncbi:MAG: hypothetical protein P8176_12435 [Gammaproteobacteria bacterium]